MQTFFHHGIQFTPVLEPLTFKPLHINKIHL